MLILDNGIEFSFIFIIIPLFAYLYIMEFFFFYFFPVCLSGFKQQGIMMANFFVCRAFYFCEKKSKFLWVEVSGRFKIKFDSRSPSVKTKFVMYVKITFSFLQLFVGKEIIH